MSIRALIIIVFAGLAACAATPSQLTNIPLADPIAIPTNEAECSAAGQLWVEQGLPGGSKSCAVRTSDRSEEHTSELQSLMSISYAVFTLKKKKKYHKTI